MKKWLKGILIGVFILAIGGFGVYRLWIYPCHATPILMYHYINEESWSLSVSPENFRRQMQYLKDGVIR
jgi:hypothetical protein